MNYYWFNRQEISQKAKERYSKEKAAEKSRERYKNFSQEEKDNIKEYQRRMYKEFVQYKKEALKNKYFFLFIHSRKRRNDKTLKFNNIRINKKEFHKSEQAIDFNLVTVDQIVVSDKLSIATMVLNILLVIKKVKLLNRCVLYYRK